jgi:hypothetical protein
MGLILLEALLALVLLVLIVWWTMFSGRKKGELVSEEETKTNTANTANAHLGKRRVEEPQEMAHLIDLHP